MGSGLWGGYPQPSPLVNAGSPDNVDFDEDRATGLRSMSEVEGYQLKAVDGALGYVDDFVLDDTDWVVKKLIVGTRAMLPGGKRYAIPVSWISDINWMEKSVIVEKSLEDLKRAPQMD
jgi:sporulation protein YlmC with PRC-barrel domain